MKIQDVKTYYLTAELDQPFGFSQFYYRKRENLLVQVVAENGSFGWGECYGPARPIQQAIEYHLKNLAVGRNVLETELIWHSAWQRHLDHMRHGTLMAGLSGLDIAIWDLKAKHVGAPLYMLLGGARHSKISCYATGHYFPKGPEERVLESILHEAEGHVRTGFKALKIKIGKNLDFDRELIRTIRKRFPNINLLADANHAYSLSEAVTVGRCLDRHGYNFFEEPLAPHALEDFRLLRSKLDLPLASGECEQTRFGFRPLIESGGVDIIQPDLAFCGGFSEALKIRHMANASGIDVTPHAWGTWIGFAAALHFHASGLPNPGRFEDKPLPLECDMSESPVKDALFSEKIQVEDGYALLPEKPGLGVEVREEALQDFIE